MIFWQEWGRVLWEVIIFLTYILVCGCLTIRRFSNKRCLAITGGVLAAILLGQFWLFFSCRDIMTVLTLLPVTAYLPSILCLHFISTMSFFQTAAVWMTGLLTYSILKIFLRISIWLLDMQGRDVLKLFLFLVALGLFLVAALLLFLVVRFLSKPFRQYAAGKGSEGLFLCLPILATLLLFSYLGNSIRSQLLLVLLLLVVIAVFFALMKALTAFVAMERMKEAKQKVAAYMQAQRREYEDMCAKMEAGRVYRHDMRHHLVVLENLAKDGDNPQIVEYIGKLRGQLSATQRKAYCENPVVNAVLSEYIQEAEAYCPVEVKISIPGELQYDEMDICAVLANALENAKNECMKIEEPEKRHIKIMAKLMKEWKFIFCVENSCRGPIQFGHDGLPAGKACEGHGIGMKSIDAIVKKYSGMLQCECKDGVFRLDAALFWPKQDRQAKEEIGFQEIPVGTKKKMPAVVGLFLLFLCGMPLLGNGLAKNQGEEKSTIQWGDTFFSIELPPVKANAVYEEALEVYINNIEEKFLSYVRKKYIGYVGCDVTYKILRDDEKFLSIRFNATINAGGSGDCSRCFTLDKQKNELVELSDLFGGDYVKAISEEILRQMGERVAAGEGAYFIPGGIWREDECFKQIDADQNFYINAQDECVIVFDEYVVAPGSMGMPEFVIPKDVLGMEQEQ